MPSLVPPLTGELSFDVAAVELEVTRTLRQLLHAELAEIETARKLESETVPVPEDLRQQLRDLGYIP